MSEFKKRIIIQVAITFGAIALIAFLIFYVSANITRLEGEITLRRTDVAFRSRALTNLNELKRDEIKAVQYINPLKNALPSKVGLFVFQDEVKRMARDKGLSVELKFVGEEEGTGVGKAKFSLEVNGDYQKIREFIKDLEDSRYFTRFEQFETFSQGANTAAYQMKISGMVFFK